MTLLHHSVSKRMLLIILFLNQTITQNIVKSTVKNTVNDIINHVIHMKP